ncbi:BQ5605_C005g03568 [Microbotryum silenes-dioicae]|uniref:BQ5605_C005g03568 protein n=1 Tax=Microbotryum silenes-dioicae TaxID=796604 RepID=A0A2X0PCW4_9BASI|nr:BQ5605_C005g03568 [Microbotryum silenes-dioicae]
MRAVLQRLHASASEGVTEDDTPRRRAAYSSQVMTINSVSRPKSKEREDGTSGNGQENRVVLANEEEASIDG